MEAGKRAQKNRTTGCGWATRVTGDCAQSTVTFSCCSVAQSSAILCDPIDCSTARLPCPSLSPGVIANSCPLSQWHYPTVSFSATPFFCPQSFAASGAFLMSWPLCIRWPKYGSFSFSISPSSEYSGLISFRMDWLNLLAVQGTLKSLL